MRDEISGAKALPSALSYNSLVGLCDTLENAFDDSIEPSRRDDAQEQAVLWVNRIDGPCDRSFDDMLEATLALAFHASNELEARENGSDGIEGVSVENWRAIADSCLEFDDECGWDEPEFEFDDFGLTDPITPLHMDKAVLH